MDVDHPTESSTELELSNKQTQRKLEWLTVSFMLSNRVNKFRLAQWR